MADEPLTPNETQCLELVSEMLVENETPSLSVVAERLGITKSGAQKHMTSLREKGYLHGPRVVGEWALTSLGKKTLAAS